MFTQKLQHRYHTQILILGGGIGGCAAALAATNLGISVILVEETDWIGGQLTTQMVPPDEHRWIEEQGCTRSYQFFRQRIRKYYRKNCPFSKKSKQKKFLNPGLGTVSNLCFEPKIGLKVLSSMLRPALKKGQLKILYYHKATEVSVQSDRIKSVQLLDLIHDSEKTIHAQYILDATELGDILPLSDTEYITGAESKKETGELHAVDGDSEPNNVQAFTWGMAVGYDPKPNASHVIKKPNNYKFWKDFKPKLKPSWPGKLLNNTFCDPITLKPRSLPIFKKNNEDLQNKITDFWTYRRIVSRYHYPSNQKPNEVTILNWPQNDYFMGNIIDKSEKQIEKHTQASRELTLSLLYWLQTEAPRSDGSIGYPGLYPRPDISGTSDGLAKSIYFRESRRIKAKFTITEAHIGATMLENSKPSGSSSVLKAKYFPDSVGIGSYRIDLHPSTGGNNYIDIKSLPFQIPLRALLPIRMRNLLPACKNIGTTHITNGCYRLHPVEWNIGEVAGSLASFCIIRKKEPHQIAEKKNLIMEFQNLLRKNGVQLHWSF